MTSLLSKLWQRYHAAGPKPAAPAESTNQPKASTESAPSTVMGSNPIAKPVTPSDARLGLLQSYGFKSPTLPELPHELHTDLESGYFTWQKGLDYPLTSHFTTREFTCHCQYSECVEQKLSIDLLLGIELLRHELGSPITITSGYRCKPYNAKVSAVQNGQHPYGNAADLSATFLKTLTLLADKYFMAIGSANSFVHVDTRDDKIRRWTY